MAHSVWLWLETQEVPGLSPGQVEYICHWGCACAMLQTVQKCLVLCTIKKPLKSFEKNRSQSRFQASFCRDIAMIVQKAT